MASLPGLLSRWMNCAHTLVIRASSCQTASTCLTYVGLLPRRVLCAVDDQTQVFRIALCRQEDSAVQCIKADQQQN